MQNGIINLDLTQPIKDMNEFKSILALVPLIYVGNILDSLDLKVANYIKRIEDLSSSEQAQMMREEYKLARQARPNSRERIVFQSDGSRDGEGTLKSWSSSYNQEVFPTA